MAEKPVGERLERVETILERMEKNQEKMSESMDKFIEALDDKASKQALHEVRGELGRVKERVWYASGAAAVLSFIAGVFGKDWLGGGK